VGKTTKFILQKMKFYLMKLSSFVKIWWISLL